MGSMALLLAYIAVRPLVCIVAGEIALRYFLWWRKTGKDVTVLRPVLLAVSILCSAVCMAEAQEMLVLAMHSVAVPGDRTLLFLPGVSLAIRLFGLIGLCGLIYPVMRYAYEEGPGVARLEAILRLFLIVASYFGGVQTVVLYHCLIMDVCR